MPEIYKTYKHNPPHLFRSNAKYFITGSTYKKVKYLVSEEAKERLLKSIFIGFTDYDWVIEDWVILDNHYHLMVNAPENVETLSRIIQDIHKFTAIWINKNIDIGYNMEYIDRVDVKSNCSKKAKNKSTNTVGALHSYKNSKIFHNYWDTCISYERSYFARLHYIWYNPVKHGYVRDPKNWKFGSYSFRFKKDKSEIDEIVDNYPCDKVKVYDDF
ncbi:MAG TPA: transposase [bacterium]|nr:transposase [bacterium]